MNAAEQELSLEEEEEMTSKAAERFGKNLAPFDDEDCNLKSTPLTSNVQNDEDDCFSSKIKIPSTISNEEYRSSVRNLNEKKTNVFL